MGNHENTKLQNFLVWSAHRAKSFSRCERQYYHQYIGSWLGWESRSSLEIQGAYKLKHLTTPQLEIGSLIHRQIRIILEKACVGWVVDPTSEIRNTKQQFRIFVEESSRRRLEDLTAKRHKLFLHEIGETITAKVMLEYEDQIASCLDQFFRFPDVQRLLTDPAALLIEHLDPPGFHIGNELGVPARPKTDAVFIDTDQTVVVADWKTGSQSEEHRRQGLVYAIFVSRRMNLPPTHSVEVRFFYLSTGEVKAFRFSDEEREEMLWQIGEDFALLQQKSDDPVINIGPERRFRPSLSPACFFCNFRLMCEPFLQSPLALQKEIE